MDTKRNKLWTLAALVLAVLTIWAVFSRSGEMSPAEILQTVRSASPGWLICAVICTFGIIAFEGEAIVVILRHIGYPRPHRRGFLYGAADVYFSAITPSASGGQPATAFFMIRDGVPAVITTAVLILNLIMYTLAVVSLGIVGILMRPAFFSDFRPVSRVLIVLGFLALSGLTVLFFFLLFHQTFLFGVTFKLVRFLAAHHLMRHPEKKLQKLEKASLEYAECVKLMTGRRDMMFLAFLYNVLQRLSQIGVILSVYMACGGSADRLADLFATQMYIILGSNFVPVPGGMGVTDYLMLDGYGHLLDEVQAFGLAVLGRSLSFYCCILISIVTVLAGYISLKKHRARGSN